MEPNSREFYKQCAFQKFCNTVLHNEACDAHRELHRHKAREVTFSDLPLDEARQLHTFDEYFKRETAETVFEYEYKVITIATSLAMSTKQYEKIAQEFEMQLNELGADGWELVQRMDGFFFFKREIK